MKKSVRSAVWAVVCCVLLVSSLGIGVAQSAGDNATNGTQSVVGSGDGNNNTQVEDRLRGSGPSQQNRSAKQPGENSTTGSNNETGAPGDQNKNGTNSSLVAFARRLKSKDVSIAQANKIIEDNPQKAKKLSDALEKMGYSHPEYTNPKSNKAKYPKEAAKFYLGNVNSGNKDKGAIDKLVSKGFDGIIHRFGKAITGGLKKFASLIYAAGTWTPHPGNAANWFQDPQNPTWSQQWDMYKTVARPLAFFLLIIATGMYFGFGSKSLHVMDPATEQTMKRRLAIGWLMFPLAWPLGGLFLGIMNLVTQFIVGGMTKPEIGAGLLGTGIAILVIIAVAVFAFWTVILMLLLFGLRIAMLVAFLPFLPAVFALRAIPIISISNAADGIIHLWVYLVILPIPMAVLLAVGFSGGLSDMIMNLDVGGALLLATMHIGALVGAIIVPFAMYQKMKEHGLATGFGNGGGQAPGHKLRESYKRQRETAARRHQQYQTGRHGVGNFNRGRRGQPEVRQDGQERLNPQGKAHRAGRVFNRGGGNSSNDSES